MISGQKNGSPQMGNRTGRDSLGMLKREIYEELDVQEKTEFLF